MRREDERTEGCSGARGQFRWVQMLFQSGDLGVRISVMYVKGCKLAAFGLELGMGPAGTAVFKFWNLNSFGR